MSLLKRTFLASLGALEVTRAKAEELIDDLIAKGELNQSDRKAAVMELLDKAESAGQRLSDKLREGAEEVERRFSEMTHDLKPARQTDLDELRDEIGRLKAEVAAIKARLDSL